LNYFVVVCGQKTKEPGVYNLLQLNGLHIVVNTNQNDNPRRVIVEELSNPLFNCSHMISLSPIDSMLYRKYLSLWKVFALVKSTPSMAFHSHEHLSPNSGILYLNYWATDPY
jgi:hypothetical protein